MFELRLLGSTDLVSREAPSPRSLLTHSKPLAILAYLAIATPRGFQRRDKLLALFWPDADEAHARGALNQALYQLRHSLGGDVIVTRGDEEVGLNWEKWWCDVVELRTAAAAERYDDVLQLYRGDLLDGFHVNASPEFEQWLDSERMAARTSARNAAVEIAAFAQANDDQDGAAVALRKAVGFDPFNEVLVERLLHILHVSGGDDDAVEEYDRYAGRLMADLETTPSAALAGFIAELRRNADAHPVQRRFTRRRRRIAAAAFVAGLAVCAILFVLYLSRPPALLHVGALNPDDVVLLADFRNTTRDSTLATVITELLRIDLAESRTVHLLSQLQVRHALQRMRRDSSAVLDHGIARELALREGAKAVLEGAIDALGPRFVLTAKLLDAERDSMLAAFRVVAGDSTDLIGAVERLSRRLRRRVGESVRDVHALPRLERVTTASLPALREFSMARRLMWQSGMDYPVKFDEHMSAAIALDSTFPMAYAALANISFSWGKGSREQAAALITRAYGYRGFLADYERAMVEGLYLRRVLQDTAGAIAAYTRALASVPYDTARQAAPLEHLAELYAMRGDRVKVEQLWIARIACDSFLPYSSMQWYEYNTLMSVQISLGKIAAAASTEEKAAARFGKDWWGRYIVDLARHDYDAAEISTRKCVNVHYRCRLRLSDLLVLRGRLLEASAVAGDTVPLRLRNALSRARVDIMMLSDNTSGIREMESGLRRESLDSLDVGERPYNEIVLLYGLAGQPESARGWLNRIRSSELELRLAMSEVARPEMGAFMAGAIAFAEHHPEQAVRLMKAIPSAELALAYQAAGRPDSAIAVLERYLAENTMLTQWKLRPASVSLPFAELRLAELYETKGDHANAARHYRSFIELWKHADPELQPVVEKARRALLRLRYPQEQRT